MDGEAEQNENSTAPSLFVKKMSMYKQHYMDLSTPHTSGRWIFFVFLMLSFMLRIYLLQGWYIITYALGIYLLNLFIAFLTPKIDPAQTNIESEDDGLALPTKNNEEFRPFMRRLPEFKFWYSSTKAVLISLCCTLFELFNIPVFWPILVVYFITLFSITMKRQIKHMFKYRYIPFTHSKTKYAGRDASPSTSNPSVTSAPPVNR